MMMSPSSLLTADLCDLYENDAEHNLQVVAPILKHFGGHTAFSGTVVTLSVKDDNAMVRATLSRPGNAGVLVIDGAGSRASALLGGNLGQLAVDHGWAGVVVNGCVRDTQELSALPLGVMAIASCPKRSAKAGVGTLNETVRFGGVTFSSGMFLVADADGVIVLNQYTPK
ncbi:MAG: ribonuclease E activity regulator RraA [Burkholderiales bacterium]|jgi:regulator of ribonuclease activity A|nr:ribonuclease E activity regulator RraA [Burkholderiales bacterium]